MRVCLLVFLALLWSFQLHLFSCVQVAHHQDGRKAVPGERSVSPIVSAEIPQVVWVLQDEIPEPHWLFPALRNAFVLSLHLFAGLGWRRRNYSPLTLLTPAFSHSPTKAALLFGTPSSHSSKTSISQGFAWRTLQNESSFYFLFK